MTKRKLATPTVRTCLTCGHVGRYGSTALADHYFPRHSCTLVEKRRAQAARHRAKLVTPGPERPCTCKYADHQHGDRSRYVIDGCRCLPCRKANRVSVQQRARDVAYGRTRHVDGEPVRVHVRGLMAQGMGLRRIAGKAGVAQSVLAKLLYGRGSDDRREVRPPTKKLERGVAAKILAVDLDLAPGARVPVIGTTRRLQALCTIGWSQAKLAAALQTTPSHVTGLVHGTRNPNLSTTLAVRVLYDRLWNVRPPRETPHDAAAYSRTVRYAAAHGWVPPVGWDDDTIDLPDTEPAHQLQPTADEQAKPRARRGSAAAVQVDDVEFLTDQGLTRDEIAERFGVTASAVWVALERAGRRDLWRRILTHEGIHLKTDRDAAA